jgi:hypothetical protein
MQQIRDSNLSNYSVFPGGKQRLMRVAEGGVGQHDTLLLTDLLSKSLWALLEEHFSKTDGRGDT